MCTERWQEQPKNDHNQFKRICNEDKKTCVRDCVSSGGIVGNDNSNWREKCQMFVLRMLDQLDKQNA